MTTWLTFQDSITRQRPRWRRPAAWSAALLAAATIAMALVQGAGDRAVQPPVPDAPPAALAVGVFTGQFVDGVPVYRLPPITVVGSRDTELAGTHHDNDPSRLRRTRG